MDDKPKAEKSTKASPPPQPTKAAPARAGALANLSPALKKKLGIAAAGLVVALAAVPVFNYATRPAAVPEPDPMMASTATSGKIKDADIAPPPAEEAPPPAAPDVVSQEEADKATATLPVKPAPTPPAPQDKPMPTPAAPAATAVAPAKPAAAPVDRKSVV